MKAFEFSPFRPAPGLPPAEHLALLASRSIARRRMPNGRDAWILATAEHVRAMLSDARFSANRADPRFPSLLRNQRVRTVGSDFTMSMAWLDGDDHARVRRSVAAEFTPKAVSKYRSLIESTLGRSIDSLGAADQPLDFVQVVARPLAYQVVCGMLGIPQSDFGFFRATIERLLDHSSDQKLRVACREELLTYFKALILARENNAGDDLLSRLVTATAGGEVGLTYKEIAELAFTLLIAGYEPPASMISLGIYTLLIDEQARQKVLRGGRYIDSAINELLRFYTVDEHSASRFALRDVEMDGVCIHAGDGVIGLSNTANRDPQLFPAPMSFDIERDARRHLSFGYGPHICIGQHLAKLEMEVVLSNVFHRLPNLRLIDKPVFRDNANIYGVESLMVSTT